MYMYMRMIQYAYLHICAYLRDLSSRVDHHWLGSQNLSIAMEFINISLINVAPFLQFSVNNKTLALISSHDVWLHSMLYPIFINIAPLFPSCTGFVMKQFNSRYTFQHLSNGNFQFFSISIYILTVVILYKRQTTVFPAHLEHYGQR